MKYLILENIRSAYNIGNIIRTADAMGRGVMISGYTVSPLDNDKVKKSALGAEQSVDIKTFPERPYDTNAALDRAKEHNALLLCAEITEQSIPLGDLASVLGQQNILGNPANEKPPTKTPEHICMVFGNEVSGVEEATLTQADYVVHIPMLGTKHSLNVGQSTAIMMREINRLV